MRIIGDDGSRRNSLGTNSEKYGSLHPKRDREEELVQGFKETRQLQAGDHVLIIYENTQRGDWIYGVIIKSTSETDKLFARPLLPRKTELRVAQQ
jgi:hypothetical protein